MGWKSAAVLLIIGAVGCVNPFAPKKNTPDDGGTQPAPPATTPEILMDNLHRAMRDRDKDLYETLLAPNFWFTESDCQGDVVYANGREEELTLMGGSRDGAQLGIFDRFRSFDFDFQLIRRSVELGTEHPAAFPGDPDGHPDEDWEVMRGRVQMLLLDENGDGYRVDQIMTYKLRRTSAGLWEIIRWIDDPLSGTCTDNTGKIAVATRGWSELRHRGM